MVRLSGPVTTPEELVTVTVAVEPGVTAHTSPVPLGVGTVKEMDPSDQVGVAKAAALPGAPQLIPVSTTCT